MGKYVYECLMLFRLPGESLKTFGERAGTSETSLNRYKNTGMKMTPATAKKIAATLGLSPMDRAKLLRAVKRDYGHAIPDDDIDPN